MNTSKSLFGINAIRPTRKHMRDYDLLLVAVIGALLMTSIVMVYSASIALSDNNNALQHQYQYLFRQLIYVGVGLAVAWFVCHIQMDIWERYSKHVFLAALLFLVLVLVPFVGRQINGAYRWIPLGFFNFQPSEFMKFAIVLYTSNYVVRKTKEQKLTTFKEGLLPILIILAVVAGLIVKEPDLGATAVICTVSLCILFLGGIQKKILAGLGGLFIVLLAVTIWLTPWRMRRFLSYLDPFSEEYAQSTGYQLIHSLIAIGRGGWTGVGLGSSIEKLHYLPEAHTDFIMAVIGEELGYVGMVAVMACFLIVVYRGYKIGRHAMIIDRHFSGYVAQGIAVWIGVQSLINFCVCIGVLPTKGLTLPLVSFGGSAMVMNLAMIALLLRVDHENRKLSRGQVDRRNHR
ncbi:putative lipid II flippase FtsW [Brackiella oedipodis]|uniref:putative lipid II flippase FtsW n=1 Tax=Brackiella oedipodis TaxID=124225 RepID=UPI000491765C|nr:putative lipid II flippase FtsW [Brackiella oedipodis]